MFKKNPYIFFKELINNSYSEDLSESVTRLALGWTQEKDYKLEYRLYYAVGSNVKFNTTYYRFNGNVHCYNELPLQLPERKLKLLTLASEKGFIKVKKKWFGKFFFFTYKVQRSMKNNLPTSFMYLTSDENETYAVFFYGVFTQCFWVLYRKRSNPWPVTTTLQETMYTKKFKTQVEYSRYTTRKHCITNYLMPPLILTNNKKMKK